jgi:hypothetical protein
MAVRVLFMTMAILQGFAAFAAPTVTDVVAKQWYPWGLVDITCKVSGIDELIENPQFVLSAVLPGSENVSKMSRFWVMRDGVKSSNLDADANGDYRLLWDAKAELGEVRYTNMVVRVAINGRQKVQLWENGPYWATTNIGAENPEDYGYYFWWGDTVGYKRNNKWVASDGSNSNFSFTLGNAPTYNKSVATLQSEGWITSDSVLAPEHDAAKKHWGGDWRMPTKQECDDLNSKCDWVWTTLNGVNGYVVRGKGDYSSASIFLPCAGYGSVTSLSLAGSYGGYWSSVPYSGSYYAWSLFFNSGDHGTDGYYRNYGRSVRPLQGFTK